MSKRKRTSKIEKWIKEGRGSGIGSELEKFEIERVYWHRKEIDWGIVTEEEIHKTMARNISYIHDCFEIMMFFVK